MSVRYQPYTDLKFTGQLGIAPTILEALQGKNLWVHILMGPTGSGKSAFIQSLSPTEELSISKDTLDSVTQEIVCYRVENLSDNDGWPFVLMDTPGFLDIKLSESRITKMISEKLDEIRQFARLWVSIFYFQPITDIRMGGSKRHAIKLLRAFADSFEANHVNIITTMWNRISNSKQREAAQQRYGALREEVYKSSDKLDIKITKYEFSTQSALFILDSNWYGWNYKKEDTGKGVDLEWRYLVRNNLVERITMKQQQLQLLAQDKELATTPGSEDYPLLEILRRDERAALTALQSFLDDLFEIDPEAARACSAPPPDPNLPGTSRILPSSESNLPVISRILPSSSLRESSHILPSYSPPVEAAQPFPPRPLKPLRPNRASYNLPSASLPLVLPPLEVPQDPSFQAALTTRFKRFSAPLKRVFVFKGTK